MQESPCLKPDWFEDIELFSIKNEYILSNVYDQLFYSEPLKSGSHV